MSRIYAVQKKKRNILMASVATHFLYRYGYLSISIYTLWWMYVYTAEKAIINLFLALWLDPFNSRIKETVVEYYLVKGEWRRGGKGAGCGSLTFCVGGFVNSNPQKADIFVCKCNKRVASIQLPLRVDLQADRPLSRVFYLWQVCKHHVQK